MDVSTDAFMVHSVNWVTALEDSLLYQVFIQLTAFFCNILAYILLLTFVSPTVITLK